MSVVYVKKIDGLIHYKVGASSFDEVTVSDPSGSLFSAITAAGLNGVIHIDSGRYSGTELDSTGGLKTSAAGQTINGVGLVVIDGDLAGTHTLSINHSVAINNLEITGATGVFYDVYSIGADVTGTNLKITNGARGIFNKFTFRLFRSVVSGITGTYIVQNGSTVSKFYAGYSSFMSNVSYLTAFKGLFSINNSLFIGHAAAAIEIATDNAQVIELNNNIFTANSVSSADKHIIKNLSANAVISGANNVILGNPFNPITYYTSNISLTDTIYKSPLLSKRRGGLVNLHNHCYDLNDLSIITPIADYAANLGQGISFCIRGTRTLSVENWDMLSHLVLQGHSVLLSTENHLSLTSQGAISIKGPAGSSVSVLVDASANSSDAWIGSLILKEAGVQTHIFSINSDGLNSNLLALSVAINDLPLWESIVTDSGDGLGTTNRRNTVLSVVLADITDIPTTNLTPILLDRNRMYFTELVEPKKIIESHGISCNGMDCPGARSDATVRAWLSSDSHGWWNKGGTNPFLASWGTSAAGSYTLAGDYQSAGAYGLLAYQIWWALVEDYINTTDIERRVSTLTDFVDFTGALSTLIFHQDTYSVENWCLVLDEMLKNNTYAKNSEATISYIRSGVDADGDGKRWVINFPENDTLYLTGGSPCESGGIVVTGTHDQPTPAMDINDKPVLFTPNIGPFDGRVAVTITDPSYTPTGYTVRAGAALNIKGGGAVNLSGLTDIGAITCKLSGEIGSFVPNGPDTKLKAVGGSRQIIQLGSKVCFFG